MTLLIAIPTALLLAVIFRFRNVSLYKKNYAGINFMRDQAINLHNTLNAAPNYRPLELSINFFNFTANIILKFVVFVILAIIKYFAGAPAVGIIFCSIYAIPTVLAWFTYKGRRTYYNEITNEYVQESFLPILKASLCIPLYQTALNILLIIVWIEPRDW